MNVKNKVLLAIFCLLFLISCQPRQLGTKEEINGVVKLKNCKEIIKTTYYQKYYFIEYKDDNNNLNFIEFYPDLRTNYVVLCNE